MRPWHLVAVGAGVVLVASLLQGEQTVIYDDTSGPGPHFTWLEWTQSATAGRLGISNVPPPDVRENIRRTTANLELLRTRLGQAVRLRSAYRSPALNRAIGGAEGSQHTTGEAVDIKVDGMTAPQLAAAIVRLNLPFDQLIGYPPELGGHVHVSFSAVGPQRGERLWSPAKKQYQAWNIA